MKSVQSHEIPIEIELDKLPKELQNLKQKRGLGHELDVKWLPGEKEGLCGEVKGDCIFVYSENQNEALQTLRHEFLDCSISEVIEPYQKIANQLVALINDETYQRKEKLVEALTRLI
jgi:hypothetical protein